MNQQSTTGHGDTVPPLAGLISLTGRVAVVTGSARGIGRAIASRLMEAGASLVVADVDGERATTTASELAAEHGGNAIGVEVDVTDHAALAGLASNAVGEFGRLDIWVNNAGILASFPVSEMSDDEWNRMIGINLGGAVFGAQAAARAMTDLGNGGVIVNIASMASFRTPSPGILAYAAAKHAILGVTKSLAVEFGGAGIRAVAVAPARVDTPGLREALASHSAAGKKDVNAVVSAPLGRSTTADDIARAVLFAASDLAAMVSGSVIVVDGAELAR